MNYFIIENGQQVGPLTIDQLRSKDITGETNVWREGMAQWGKAKDIPEIASILQLGTTPPPPPCTPNYSQHSQQPPQYGHNTPQPTQPCPDNHLGLSIAATIITLICCFPLPIGIIALVYSLNVENKWKQGNYDKASNNAKNAKGWAIGSIIAAAVIVAIYLVIYAILGVAFFEIIDEASELNNFYY